MVNLCEVCNNNIATTGVSKVKLCRDCFHTIRTKEDPSLCKKFNELVNSRASATQELSQESAYKEFLTKKDSAFSEQERTLEQVRRKGLQPSEIIKPKPTFFVVLGFLFGLFLPGLVAQFGEKGKALGDWLIHLGPIYLVIGPGLGALAGLLIHEVLYWLCSNIAVNSQN